MTIELIEYGYAGVRREIIKDGAQFKSYDCNNIIKLLLKASGVQLAKTKQLNCRKMYSTKYRLDKLKYSDVRLSEDEHITMNTYSEIITLMLNNVIKETDNLEIVTVKEEDEIIGVIKYTIFTIK